MAKESKNKKQERRATGDDGSQDRLSRVLSICALVVAVLSFAFVIWRELETRYYVRLSTRPVIHFETIRVPYGSRQYIGLYMGNYGTGPATFESVVVYVDGEVVQASGSSSLTEAFRQVGLLDNLEDFVYVTSLPRFMPSGEQPLCIIGISSEDYTPQQAQVLWDALSHISMDIVYSSVYGTVYQGHLDNP